MIDALALVGAITIAVLAIRTARWFWKSRNWKPTPWLGEADEGAQMTRRAVKKLLLATAILAAMAVPSRAGDQDMDSANFVMRGCRSVIANQHPTTLQEVVETMWCMGLVDAIGFDRAGICAPPHVTTGQVVRVVVQYIDSRPARLNEDFRALALEALQAAWPCSLPWGVP